MRKTIELLVAAALSTVIGCQGPLALIPYPPSTSEHPTPAKVPENVIEIHGYKTTQLALDYLKRVAAFKTGDFEIEADFQVNKSGPFLYHTLKFPLYFADKYTPTHDPNGAALQDALYLADNPYQLFGPLAGSCSKTIAADNPASQIGDKIVTVEEAMSLYEITIDAATSIIRNKLLNGDMLVPKKYNEEEF